MRRREFITVIGSGAVTWPLAKRVRSSLSGRGVSACYNTTADDTERQAWLGAFRQALEGLGWAEGRNMQIDYRWGAGDAERTRKYATELVALAPDVILTLGAASVGPLLQATGTVPIVFPLIADPVGGGFVDSLARPGGNATGFIFSNTLSVENGLSCSRKLRRASRCGGHWGSCGTAGTGLFSSVQAAASSARVEVSLAQRSRRRRGGSATITFARSNGGLILAAGGLALLIVTRS